MNNIVKFPMRLSKTDSERKDESAWVWFENRIRLEAALSDLEEAVSNCVTDIGAERTIKELRLHLEALVEVYEKDKDGKELR